MVQAIEDPPRRTAEWQEGGEGRRLLIGKPSARTRSLSPSTRGLPTGLRDDSCVRDSVASLQSLRSQSRFVARCSSLPTFRHCSHCLGRPLCAGYLRYIIYGLRLLSPRRPSKPSPRPLHSMPLLLLGLTLSRFKFSARCMLWYFQGRSRFLEMLELQSFLLCMEPGEMVLVDSSWLDP